MVLRYTVVAKTSVSKNTKKNLQTHVWIRLFSPQYRESLDKQGKASTPMLRMGACHRVCEKCPCLSLDTPALITTVWSHSTIAHSKSIAILSQVTFLTAQRLISVLRDNRKIFDFRLVDHFITPKISKNANS